MANRTLHVLDNSGHSTMTWDPEVETPEQVKLKEEAKAKFDQVIKDGYLVYTLTEDRTKGEVIRKFDPEVSMTASPQLQGG